MNLLTIKDLLSLEEYHKQRNLLRQELRQHKAIRRIAIGPHVHLFFEDKKTMLYQIQEMLYIEKMIDEAEIQDELDTYNPIIPTGDNWKATMMIEYIDETERRKALKKLMNIENQVYLKIHGHDKLYAIADEDLERTNKDKTSAVHFLRFQLNKAQIVTLKKGTNFTFGIDHLEYVYESLELPMETKQQLLKDLKD